MKLDVWECTKSEIVYSILCYLPDGYRDIMMQTIAGGCLVSDGLCTGLEISDLLDAQRRLSSHMGLVASPLALDVAPLGYDR